MSHTEPSPRVIFATCVSFTNLPSLVKTWMRSFGRSQTYTIPSFVGSAQWTGVRNCLRERRVRIVVAERRVVRLLAVGAPVALELAGVHVDDGDAVVAVAVGDVRLVRGVVDRDLRHLVERPAVVAAGARVGEAELLDELAVLA